MLRPQYPGREPRRGVAGERASHGGLHGARPVPPYLRVLCFKPKSQESPKCQISQNIESFMGN